MLTRRRWWPIRTIIRRARVSCSAAGKRPISMAFEIGGADRTFSSRGTMCARNFSKKASHFARSSPSSNSFSQ